MPSSPNVRYPIGRFDFRDPFRSEDRPILLEQLADAPSKLRGAVAGLSEQPAYRGGGKKSPSLLLGMVVMVNPHEPTKVGSFCVAAAQHREYINGFKPTLPAAMDYSLLLDANEIFESDGRLHV